MTTGVLPRRSIKISISSRTARLLIALNLLATLLLILLDVVFQVY